MLGALNLRRAGRGFTLIELLIGMAVMVVLAMLAAPSIKDMVQMQRLRGTNAQVVTDLQYARAEAAARSRIVRVSLGSNDSLTCYTLYLAPNSATRCDCTRGPGAACAGGLEELRTVVVERSSGVRLSWPADQVLHFGFDNVSGGLLTLPSDLGPSVLPSLQIESVIDDDRRLRNAVIGTGRVSICAPNAQRMGVTAC